MKITAHHPQFLPWAGYWQKALEADLLVMMLGVQWDKNQTTNRVRVEGQWVTLPVKVGPDNSLLSAAYDPHGLRKAVLTIEQKLMSRKNPYGRRLLPLIETMLSHQTDSLVSLNLALQDQVFKILGRGPKVVVDSQPLEGDTKTLRLKNLLLRNAKLQPSLYLSGMGGRAYLEPEVLGLPVEYVQGQWPDCSIVQLIAQHEDPLKVLLEGRT